MNFRTQVELPKRETEIRHSDRIMLFGSCFAENIGNLLLANKFRCDVNPFGILYNPLSIVEALWQILSHQTYTEEDLFYAGVCIATVMDTTASDNGYITIITDEKVIIY